MKDNFKGIVERGCPLCNWFGIVGAFNTHWCSHVIFARQVYHLERMIKKVKKVFKRSQ